MTSVDVEMEQAPAQTTYRGIILEAAFVDPTYEVPESAGNSPIELKASSQLLQTTDGIREPEAPPKIQAKRVYVTETEQQYESRCGIFNCCKKNVTVNSHTYFVGAKPVNPKEAERLRKEYLTKQTETKKMRKEREQRERENRRRQINHEKYSKVPEGVLIYRLDTNTCEITLVSAPHPSTNRETVLRQMTVVNATPSSDKDRRGIILTGENGEIHKLIACEQRTAVTWMEAMDMMISRMYASKASSWWGQQNMSKIDRDRIEEQYLNLAAYSNNLIRTGTIGNKSPKASHVGIYYSVTKYHEPGEKLDEETLESIAKRRAVIKDSWDFYRMVCSLLRDRRKYNESFRRIQLDSVYPYVNSMAGLNDPGDTGLESDEKLVLQKDVPEYEGKSRTEVCRALIKKAEVALPNLVELCKALAGSLGVEEVGVGPIKEVTSALRKAERKYHGDVLKITDFCRTLLVVKDLPTMLALLELARDSFGPLIRRVKLSTLKSHHKALPGGYRDCKLNVELNDHICEIQIHLSQMWAVCGADGFRHYRHCLEYSTDTFSDSYDALVGLDKKTLAELIVMAEEAVASVPIEQLESGHEKHMLDYFAEVGLFIYHGQFIWAETTLRHLIRLRVSNPDIGPDHEETLYLNKYFEVVLRRVGKDDEADEVLEKIRHYEKMKKKEKDDASDSLWDTIVDPTKNVRLEEERVKKEVKASKRAWRKIRAQRFNFLNSSSEGSVTSSSNY